MLINFRLWPTGLFITIMVMKGLAPDEVNGQDDKGARADIRQSNAKYFTAFSKGDSSIFINRYTGDCHIMAPEMPSFKGRSGAASFYSIAYEKLGVRGGHFETEKIYGQGNYVTEEGSYALLDKNQKVIDEGKYLVLWQRTILGWKMFRDCFNSNHNTGASG